MDSSGEQGTPGKGTPGRKPYLVPDVPGGGERKLYIQALEQRVADLESQLPGAGEDHYHDGAHEATQRPAPTENVPTDSPATASGSHPECNPDEGGEIMIAVRDLSLSASGHYVGASSHIDVGRVLSSVVSRDGNPRPMAARGPGASAEDSDPAPKSAHPITRSEEALDTPPLTSQVAARLMKGWSQHIATRYPVLHTPRVRWLYTNQAHLTDVYDRAILHLVYAVSGRWLESSGEMGYFFSDQYYDLAIAQMNQIQRLRDERTVDYLLLLALYCTRAPRDPGAWTFIGAAMRLCVELGLHRKRPQTCPSVQRELSKRRFWTAYFLDRDISIAIGRPPGISDHDLDCELPLDIDEAVEDDATVLQAAQDQNDPSRWQTSTLTPFIHRLRLKRIESEIQHLVYRVDIQDGASTSLIDHFLDRLSSWKHQIPLEAGGFEGQVNPDVPYDGAEFYTIHYHRCVRFLLYPQLCQSPLNYEYVRLCADACQGIISDYRKLHVKYPVGFSALSIQSVFLSAQDQSVDAHLSLNDCMLLLYIICERYPSARRYRDIFERVKSASAAAASQGIGIDSQKDVASIPDAHTVNDATHGWTSEFSNDLMQMIDEMTGQAIDPFLGVSSSLDSNMGYGSPGSWWS
ncbi:uncharacterized protein LTR77_001497 [Saxophila tyrrhenica]|uniref:Xylanolytic transcriptional activator regulatory domain-containing protein n=1 Tax=Saxophila tyrrhenica TaxID=1690608 RepID=A0AAV9PQ26_9PEZI|nr:hypothetical protein LTR77_001497 [Saxophila tyrrhenica]